MADSADANDLTDLLARTVQVVSSAQERLDRTDGGTMYSIPSAAASLEFGLVTRRTKKFLFIPTARASARLHHRVKFSLYATPDPPEPLLDTPPPDGEPFPVTLNTPAFLADAVEESEAVERLLSALRGGRWRAIMRRPDKLDQRRVDAAALALEQAHREPDPERLELGVVVFRVSDEPPRWVVVHLTGDSDNDGVFLLEGGAEAHALVFTMARDGNDKVAYMPLHMLVLALRRWLREGASRRTLFAGGLPRRWGISSLEHLGRSLLDGYRRAAGELAARAGSSQEVYFDISDVTADVSYSVSCAKETPHFSVVERPGAAHAVEGRVTIETGRRERAGFLELTLVAPGYVMTGAGRDAFVARMLASSGAIACCFTMSRRDQDVYRRCIAELVDPREVVVLVSAENAGSRFRYLVVWPGIEGRDFVFSCRQDSDTIEDFRAVMRLDDELGAVRIDAPESGDGGLAEDQYQHFHRFFRGARLWCAGLEGS